MHNSACRSGRKTPASTSACDFEKSKRLQHELQEQDMTISGDIIDRGTAKMKDMKIKDIVSIRADHEIYQECLRSVQQR